MVPEDSVLGFKTFGLSVPALCAQEEEDEGPTCVLTDLDHFQDGIGLKDKFRLWRFNNCIMDNCGPGEMEGTYEVVDNNLEVTC